MMPAIRWVRDIILYKPDERGYIPIAVEFQSTSTAVLHVVNSN